MNNSPLVSVIIPAYNHEKYIKETINAIINQTYKNIELIVLDDGSKDSTWEKIQEMKGLCEERFINVHFETKENEGTGKTLNKLVKLAKGEFIFDTASDDITMPYTIEEEVEFLKNNKDYGLIVGDNQIIDENGNVAFWDKNRNLIYNEKNATYKTFADFCKRDRDFNFCSDKFGLYETLYTGNYIPNGYMIRKSIYDAIEPFSEKTPLEDWFLMLQISKYCKMKYIDKIVCSYRCHSSNSIKNDEKMAEYARITREYEEEILNNIDETKVLPNVLKVKKYGSCYKKRGIPFIFQILTFKKYNKKIKIIKLFNIPIYSYEKKRKILF